MTDLYRARLPAVAARRQWDGQWGMPERACIPGLRDFQKGVLAFAAALRQPRVLEAAQKCAQMVAIGVDLWRSPAQVSIQNGGSASDQMQRSMRSRVPKNPVRGGRSEKLN